MSNGPGEPGVRGLKEPIARSVSPPPGANSWLHAGFEIGQRLTGKPSGMPR